MSLRAIKKRENQLNPIAGARQTLFKKSSNSSQQRKFVSGNIQTTFSQQNTLNLQQQQTLLGRSTHSNPELHQSVNGYRRQSEHLVRTKSESDVAKLLSSCGSGTPTDTRGHTGLLSAKSEVCLQSISSHSYQQEGTSEQQSSNKQQQESRSLSRLNHPEDQKSQQHPTNMYSGARSHRDLTQSSYNGHTSANSYDIHCTPLSPTRRRMSECSLSSSITTATGGGSGAYSQRTSALSGSAITLSSQTHSHTTLMDPNTVVRVPIIGYEVMEERARFTVYKLRVENPHTNDCWLVLRRYTDFVRLHTKLKQSFPYLNLMLPRKKIFGDNFNSVFLDNRVQGLQLFVNSIMSKEELRQFKMVREFFCLDEPPSYSESMEECRAIFEAQEETIAHLKLQISSKNDLILSLQQKLRDEIIEKEHLKDELINMSTSCSKCNNITIPASTLR